MIDQRVANFAVEQTAGSHPRLLTAALGRRIACGTMLSAGGAVVMAPKMTILTTGALSV